MSLHTTRTTNTAAAFGSRPMDPSQRLRTYGRIRPLESNRTWWERLLRR